MIINNNSRNISNFSFQPVVLKNTEKGNNEPEDAVSISNTYDESGNFYRIGSTNSVCNTSVLPCSNESKSTLPSAILPEPVNTSGTFYSGDFIKPEAEYTFKLYSPDSKNSFQPSSTTIGIVHTNDEHDNTFKKFGREATIVKQRETIYGDENSYIINLGDITYNGNSKEKNSKFFGPAKAILNSMGVEFFVPGNHDLEHGSDFLKENILSGLEATGLLGNVAYKSGGTLENIKAYKIEEINGVKVGFIGVTTPKSHGEDKKEEDFTVTPIAESLQKLIPQVKNEGAEITVVLMHEGINTARSVAQTIPGIDVIIAGHDHKKAAEEVKNPDGKNTVIVEAGGNTNYVGDMAIEIDRSSKKILSINYKLFSTGGVNTDPEINEIVRKYKSTVT
ncbi:MAG: metallophosphoesterase [Candidatus Eremiobacterota bacterium]